MGWPDWRGECVAIVASGPSAKGAGVEKLRGRINVIAVNESWQLAPWADILYGADSAWWKLRNGVTEFKGLRVTQDKAAASKFPDLIKIEVVKNNGKWVNDLLTDEPGKIGSGGHSGFQATNIAVHPQMCGCTGVLWVGFDMRPDLAVHWHGRHPQPLANPMTENYKRWRETLDGVAPKFKALGVDVVNCSSVSALEAYPKMTIPEALARWGL